MMQRRTPIAEEVLAGSSSDVIRMGEVISVSHHQRWDGTGQPHGLSGEAIPLAGQLVAVADVFDALTLARRYEPAWLSGRALVEVRWGRGSQFDPQVVEVFERPMPQQAVPLEQA